MPFGLWDKKVQVTVDRQKQVDINYATRQLERGNLSFILGNNTNLEAGSFVLSLHDVSFLEPVLAEDNGRRVKRAMKGLYPFAQSKSQDFAGEKLTQVDTGTMTIAGDGIAFTGQTEKINTSFDNIEATDYVQNKIMIATKTPAQRLFFDGVERTTVSLKVQDRVYRQPLSGKVVQLVIKAMMAQVSLNGG